MNLRNASLLAAAAVTTAGLFSAAGCELIAVPDRSLIPEGVGGGGVGGSGGTGGEATTGGGMGGQGGTGGVGGQGGQGGEGGSMCTGPGDCPGATDCLAATCTNGVCGTEPVAAGTALPAGSQTDGDCRLAVCDGAGATGSQNDDADLPIDNLDCTMDVCTNGVPSNPPVAQGDACDDGSGSVCDDAGNCVECNVNGDCALGNVCQAEMCVPALCNDGAHNGTETDTDCGGLACAPCVAGDSCLLPTDCDSQVCTSLVCQAPTCTDNVQNQDETDEDCGGAACPDCIDGLTCAGDGDCASGFCTPGTLICATPTCSDTFQNQGETGVDCGGPCGTCNGDACTLNSECASGMCYQNVCVATINACDIDTAQDLGAGPAIVTFANGNFTYAPKCIKVSVGATVTFNGNFANHPHQGGQVVAGVEIADNTGPFGTLTNTDTTKDFPMDTAGTFPYYCVPHGGGGMNGVVFVVP